MTMLMSHSSLSWGEINLSALQHNLELVRSQLHPETKVMAVVKANAYGHGAVPVSRALIEYGVDAIAVASVTEAVRLRTEDIAVPILVLGSIHDAEFEALDKYDLAATINNLPLASRLNDYARDHQRQMKVHIRIDTGMGSYGLLPEECSQFFEQLSELKFIEIAGTYTHLNTIYGGRLTDARQQVSLFTDLINQMYKNSIEPGLLHVCSSPAVLRLPEAEFNMVRLGIVLYGLPCGNQLLDDQLQQVMQIKSRVIAIKEVGAGTSLGYGWTFTACSPRRVATLPIGYADAGFLHYMKNGEVLIHGQRAAIIGKSCMDHLIIDVSEVDNVVLGDEAVIMGTQGEQSITAAEIASRCGINPNNLDVVCLLGPRMPLVYTR